VNAVVRKWGNSAAVRIPARVLADAGLNIDQPVEIREERGRIIIERARERKFKLDDLLNEIRPDNLHEAVETGDPEMEAAIAEAKRRWPEFAAHFSRRDLKNDVPFIVKAPFGKGDNEEFMWVSVEAIDSDLVRGKLANQPHRIPDMYDGQEVTVPVSAIMDWMCVDERKQAVGGWTQRILVSRARSA
jgi:antitoxin MazE